MLYQFPPFTLPYILAVDAGLIGLILASTLISGMANQRVLYGMALLGFLGLGSLKFFAAAPGRVASIPATLLVEAPDYFTTLYYGGTCGDGKPQIVQKAFVVGTSRRQHFELESCLTNGLIVAAKFDGAWYQTTVTLNAVHPTRLVIEKSRFRRADQALEASIAQYGWTEWGIYLSVALTMAFVATLVWRIRKHGY